ncbi:hypothetical protein ACFVIN_01410 [Streptomyces prasinus]|uniref:hypothetical protein n=1 Tax=Streptomyces prasinus TaxID=67345 RepID=UPI00362E28BE
MTPIERLLQEAVPARIDPPGPAHTLWTEQEQDRHWDELCRTVGTPGAPRPARPAADSSRAAA